MYNVLFSVVFCAQQSENLSSLNFICGIFGKFGKFSDTVIIIEKKCQRIYNIDKQKGICCFRKCKLSILSKFIVIIIIIIIIIVVILLFYKELNKQTNKILASFSCKLSALY